MTNERDVCLTVHTKIPTRYLLHSEENGMTWRGNEFGYWEPDPNVTIVYKVATLAIAPVSSELIAAINDVLVFAEAYHSLSPKTQVKKDAAITRLRTLLNSD